MAGQSQIVVASEPLPSSPTANAEAGPLLPSPFLFAVCQIGAEAALKAEIQRAHPGFRPAFARPGLCTFRCDPPVDAETALQAVFSRAHGASLGTTRDDAALLALARRLPGPLCLQVFPRDLAHPSGDDDSDQPLADEVAARLRAAAPGLFLPPGEPRPGALVFDVIVARGEPTLCGCHRHGPGRPPYPGGRAPLRLPPDAPSRAWLKLEEGLRWSGLPVSAGQTAIEIGSAPGGASHALLTRGLHVVGVDPGAMDARVLAHPRFTHLQLPLGDLRREQLPARVDWLLLDVNLAPQVALHGARRIVSTLRGTLRGVLFTLKLNDWGMASSVPGFLQRVAGMGLREVRATQLPSNRREICVTALGPHQVQGTKQVIR